MLDYEQATVRSAMLATYDTPDETLVQAIEVMVRWITALEDELEHRQVKRKAEGECKRAGAE